MGSTYVHDGRARLRYAVLAVLGIAALGTAWAASVGPAGADHGYAITVNADSASVSESGGPATFTVSITAEPTRTEAVTVDWSTVDIGDATVGDDFQDDSGTVTFPALDNSDQTISVVLNDDDVDEPAESFAVRLDNVSEHGTISGDGEAQVSIADDDPTPIASFTGDVAMLEGDAGTTSFVFTVKLFNPSQSDVTVDFATADGTAQDETGDADYTATSGTLLFAGGSTEQTVSVSVSGDTIVEGDETFTVTLSNGAGVVVASDGSQTATGTIEEDDLTIAIADAPDVVEGDSGTTAATFTVTASDTAPKDVTFRYDTADGTAQDENGDGDYEGVAEGSATILAGQTSVDVPITVNGDIAEEDHETFDVVISEPDGAVVDPTVGADTGTATIGNDDTSISVDDPSVTEGDVPDTTTATFTVTLSKPVVGTVTVDYGTAPGTATEGTDYDAASGTVTFTPGDVEETVDVTVNGDDVDEADETFDLGLSNPSGANIADDGGTATITDDDAPPTLTVTQDEVPGVREGDAGETTTTTFTVTLSEASERNVTFDWSTSDGTATSSMQGTPPLEPPDYESADGSATIPAGSLSAPLGPITVNGDDEEGDHATFFVDLQNIQHDGQPDGPGTARGTGTILDDETTISVGDAPTVTEGGDLVFDVELSTQYWRDIDLTWDTADDTATAGSDYTAVSGGSATIAQGDTSTMLTVTTLDDSVDEPDTENLTVTISGVTDDGVGVTVEEDQGAGSIEDNDATPTATVAGPSGALTEGTDTVATFTITLSEASDRDLVVEWSTESGTATAGEDYTASGGTVTVPAGDTSVEVDVPVLDDALDEDPESFSVRLTEVTGADAAAVGSPDAASATIDDDDPMPTVSIADRTVDEDTGTAELTVSLDALSGRDVSVDWATADGSATAGQDYTASGGPATIPAGDQSTTVSVPITDDTTDEPDEDLTVTLTDPTNAQLDGSGGDVATLTITDNDAPPEVSILDGSGEEGDVPGDAATVDLTVQLSEASANEVQVTYSTESGSAVAGSDYVAQIGQTAIIAPGDTTTVISVEVIEDTDVEDNETFRVRLSSAANASIADPSGTGTILNDDVSFSIDDFTDVEGDSGTTDFVFTVLSTAAGVDVTVDWATSDGTATAGEDYVADSGTLTIPAGDTSGTITVVVNGDVDDPGSLEGNETFFVDLSNPSHGSIDDGRGVGTIVTDDEPTISIDDVEVREGDIGTTSAATFTVTLSDTVGSDVTFDYATADADATIADGDYDEATGSGTITAGTTSTTIDVTINGDDTDEPFEAFQVNLSNASNATVGDGTGIGTILNDDATLSVADAGPIAEGDGPAVVTIALSNQYFEDVAVDYATSDGTAVAGEDYTATSGSVTIVKDADGATVNVALIDDVVDEEDEETFTLTVSNPTSATEPPTIMDAVGDVTISDDDPQPSVSVTGPSAPVSEADAATTDAVFTVTLSAESSRTVTVGYATSDGTATAGQDYTTTNGTLTFDPGETSKTVQVPVLDDAVDEPDTESFVLDLSNPTNASEGDTQATGQILDDDDAPTLSIDDVPVTEGDSGSTTAHFTVTLSTASDRSVTVEFATSDDTATAPSDYVANSGTVTFAPGQTAEPVDITVNGDTADEADETFAVTLSNPSNATIADDIGVGTILNDDATVSIGDASVTEGDAGTTTMSFTVSLANPSTQTVTVDYATVDGSAQDESGDGDYAAGAGTVTFAPGETSKRIDVMVNGDTVDEPDETFTVELSSPTNATVSDGTGQGTITNDDDPTVSIGDATVTEGDTGTVDAVFDVTLSNASTDQVTVDYATADGSAQDEGGDGDYAATSGTLTFAAGETAKTVTVTVNGDTDVESDETFTVVLSNVSSNAAIGDGTGQGTITNDDAFPVVTISATDASATEEDPSDTGTWTLTRSGDTSAALDVTVAVSGSATRTTDYTLSGASCTDSTCTVTIPASSATADVTLTTVDDTAVEGDETATLTVQDGASYDVGTPASDTVTISETDTAPGPEPDSLEKRDADPTVARGEKVCVEFEATDADGQPVEGVTVRVELTGANENADDLTVVTGPCPTSSGTTQSAVASGTTDANGIAAASYTPDASGTDTLTGWADLDDDGVQDGDEPATTYTVTVEAPADQVIRLHGDARETTAVDVSQEAYPTADSAGAVVLARSDDYPDALAGAPFAVTVDAPLLLTPAPHVAASEPWVLHPDTAAEIDRVLPDGGRVYVLGGEVAIGDDVVAQLEDDGYDVVRVAGRNRFETAIRIAERVTGGAGSSPSTILVTTGTNFPDALAAGAAAVSADGVIVLSDGDQAVDETGAYLDAHPSAVRYAVGGPAARAYGARVPDGNEIVGATRYETATLVAERFFSAPEVVGVARGDNFPDGLSGGTFLGRLGAPLVLTHPDDLDLATGENDAPVSRQYLEENADVLSTAYLFGGPVAISSGVADEVAAAMG